SFDGLLEAVVFVAIFTLYHIAVSIYHVDYLSVARFAILPLVFLTSILSARCEVLFFRAAILVFFFCSLVSIGIELGVVEFWEKIFGRNASIFFDPNYAGAMFGFGTMLCLVYANEIKFSKVFLIFLFIALLLTYSRGSYVAFLVAFALFVWVRYR